MSYPPVASSNGDHTPAGGVDLDYVPPEALGALLAVELRSLYPRFGVLPDILLGPQLSFGDVWERTRAVMDNPVKVLRWRGNKRVIQVLGQWVLVVWASGRITPLVWHVKYCGHVSLKPVDPDHIDLFHLATRSDWLSRQRDALHWEYVNHHVSRGGDYTDPQPRDLNLATHRRLLPQVTAHIQQHRLDAKIREQMSLDRAAMQSAVSLVALKRLPGDSEVRISSYHWALEHRHELAQMRKRTPELLQWYAMCAQQPGFVGQEEPSLRLQRFLQSRGMSRRGLQLVRHYGHTILVQAVRHKPYIDLYQLALAHLYAHANLGGGGLVPIPLYRLMCKYLGLPHGHAVLSGGPLSQLVQLWKDRPPKSNEEKSQWDRVLRWVQHCPSADLYEVERKGGFRYLFETARLWERESKQALERKALDLSPSLYVWHDPLEQAEWKITFKRSHRELLDDSIVKGSTIPSELLSPSFDLLYGEVLWHGDRAGVTVYRFQGGRWALADARRDMNRLFSIEDRRDLSRLARLIRTPVFPARTGHNDRSAGS